MIIDLNLRRDSHYLAIGVKAGIILIGSTLTSAGGKDEESASVWRRTIACCEKVDPRVLR